jgi:YD repeat-containing protein
MPRGGTTQTRTFTYYPNGKPWTRTEPETGITAFTHNSYGMLATKLDAKGQASEYTYDTTYRRLTKIEKYPSGVKTERLPRGELVLG